MSMWIDTKYVNLISGRVRNFKRKSQNLWNFSCPLCGDSTKDKSKARGYVYPIRDKLVFHCHNCSVTKSVGQLIKYIDSGMYDEYSKESLLEKTTTRKQNKDFLFEKPVFINNDNLKKLSKISQLPAGHFAKQYIVSRLIPSPYHTKLYYCPEFKAWTNSFIPNKFEDTSKDEARLIIPIFDSNKNMIGFQGRAFDAEAKIRYFTIMLDESKPRIYNMDTLDFSKPAFMLEGPIDSMFLENAGASCGGDIISELSRIVGLNKANVTIVYDNEPRNKDTIAKIKKAIDFGFPVCIWPSDIEHKDVAKMVESRCKIRRDYVNTEYVMKHASVIQNLIEDNTFQGAMALLKLNEWKRISN